MSRSPLNAMEAGSPHRRAAMASDENAEIFATSPKKSGKSFKARSPVPLSPLNAMEAAMA